MTPYETIEKAITMFNDYAKHHALKDPPDKDKVERNITMGCDLEDALEELRAKDQAQTPNTILDRGVVLRILMLLSALESWSFSLSKPLPDFLHEDLMNIVNELKEEVLK
jgi:hypothetical protein